MKLLLLAVLPFASHANPKCYTGDVKTPDDKVISKDEFLDVMHMLLGASIMNVIKDEPQLEDWMKTRGTCQESCLESMMKPAMATVYGKMGKDLFTDDGKQMGIEAFTGGFRACYPSPPRSEIKKLAETVFEGMGNPPKEGADFPQGETCENAEHEDDFPLKEVTTAFKDAFGEVVQKKPDVMKFFEEKALACQLPCLSETVPLAIKTLFLTNQDDKNAMSGSITGAMHACFPGVPSSAIESLVDETLGSLMKAEEGARLRLYNAKMIKWGSSNFIPLCGIFTAMTLMLFFAGVAVGRKWKRSSFREVSQDDQIGLIVTPAE